MRKLLERAFNKYNDKGWLKFVSDEACLKILYHMYFDKKLNLDDPKTFNEKLQWLKLYDRKPIYTTMVDKYEVKKYVADIIGEEYIIPTLGVWDSFDEIDFDALPDQFVLKCTHDSGGLVICRDKEKLDISAAKKKLEDCLKREFFYTGREWPYKNVKPRIIAENYMKDSKTEKLRDYKFFCFNGEPKMIYISEGMDDHSTAQMSFYDLEGKKMPFHRADYLSFAVNPDMPETLPEMIDLSRLFAKKTECPFVRIDFYCVNGKTYFSEITFFHGSGFSLFEPEEWDLKLGEWLTLPEKN